ncbi:MAG: type II secretion system protein GspM [Gammaproteobacteria bacterium]|jgi:general secretion pathway protein M
MKDWFLSLERRERLFLGVGAVAVVLLLVWALLISPLSTSTSATTQRVEMKRETLAFLRGAAAELAGAGGVAAAAAGPNLAGQSLVVIVDRTARTAGLGTALTRNQPVGEDGIRVRLDNASFDAVAAWLATLSASAGMSIESASFDRTPDEGRVNASLVLRQGLQ